MYQMEQTAVFPVGSLQKSDHSALMTQVSAGQEGQTLADAIKGM